MVGKGRAIAELLHALARGMNESLRAQEGGERERERVSVSE